MQHTTDIVLEGARQGLHILGWEQSSEIRRFWGVAPKQGNPGRRFEEPGDLVAGHEDGDRPSRTGHPFEEFPLGMRVRSVDFVQTKTERGRIPAEQRRNAAGMLAGLGQSLDIRETSEGLRCVEFQRLKSTRSRGREHERRLPNPGRAMEKQDTGIGRGLEVRPDPLLDIGMSEHGL